MNLPNDLSLYLPKYLSAESTKILLEELKNFPNNVDQRFYTQLLLDKDVIFQGDGIKDFLVINLPNTAVNTSPVIIMSNTCDIDLNNQRDFPSQISYAPLFNLSKYVQMLQTNGKSPQSVNAAKR